MEKTTTTATLKYISFMLVLFIFIISFPVVSHTNAVWVYGSVKTGPWVENSTTYIQIDDRVYSILPDIQIAYMHERNEGAYDEKNVSVNYIVTGQKISARVRNNEIVQIILF